MIDKRIGRRIRERRKVLGLTQEEFSEKIGVAPHYISMIERGESFPRYEVLIDLLNGLECSADLIFQDVLNHTAEYKASALWEKIEPLSASQRGWVLTAVESMISAAQSRDEFLSE